MMTQLTMKFFHLRLYAIAAQNSQDIIQCQEPLYQTRITTCLNDHGIIHKISVAEWLIWRQKNSKDRFICRSGQCYSYHAFANL